MPRITALCRAYVDLIVPISYDTLKGHGFLPGQDYLIPKEQIAQLTAQYIDQGTIYAGGPGANTIAGFKALGGDASFIGKVSNDILGQQFTKDLQQRGIQFDTAIIENDITASCVIFVMPNGTRTILYNPSIADDVTLDDITRNEKDLKQSSIFYMGWLNREQHCKIVTQKSIDLTGHAKRVSSLQSYGSRQNDDFSSISVADIILGNEGEYSLFMADMKLDSMEELANVYPDKILACTLGKEGAAIYHGAEKIDIPAKETSKVVDTTGAGDAWAAGFLYGIAHNLSLSESGQLGASCAAEIITHQGGRPQNSWAHLLS
jgi:sugar/nucleoside kinase (ribokinase family)